MKYDNITQYYEQQGKDKRLLQGTYEKVINIQNQYDFQYFGVLYIGS